MKINQWLIWSLVVALQVWAGFAWCGARALSDDVSAAGQTSATETIKPAARIQFTASAVLVDTNTTTGREPK